VERKSTALVRYHRTAALRQCRAVVTFRDQKKVNVPEMFPTAPGDISSIAPLQLAS
jgi:hypothetical protein